LNEFVGRAAATQRFLTWLNAKLDRHPAAVARVKVGELLSARMPEEAEVELREMVAALEELSREVAAQKRLLDKLDGSIQVTSEPSGLRFTLVDGFANQHSGVTPARLDGVAPGACQITMKRDGFRDEQGSAVAETGKTVSARVDVVSETIVMVAEPEVEFWSNNQFLSKGQFQFSNYRPNTYAIELRRPNTQSFPTTVTVNQGKGTRTLNYNLSALATQKLPCYDCSQKGNLEEDRDCSACDGHGNFKCNLCGSDGILGVLNGAVIRCYKCGGEGSIRCKSCGGEGKIRHRTTCGKCGGDGLLSEIDAAR
ncbi:MAG: hypothetical protein SGI92_06025, partial [Bryobacteraceae bacterium]|nr:hypothetical protein [Bryobacteraceae bacterium]